MAHVLRRVGQRGDTIHRKLKGERFFLFTDGPDSDRLRIWQSSTLHERVRFARWSSYPWARSSPAWQERLSTALRDGMKADALEVRIHAMDIAGRGLRFLDDTVCPALDAALDAEEARLDAIEHGKQRDAVESLIRDRAARRENTAKRQKIDAVLGAR